MPIISNFGKDRCKVAKKSNHRAMQITSREYSPSAVATSRATQSSTQIHENESGLETKQLETDQGRVRRFCELQTDDDTHGLPSDGHIIHSPLPKTQTGSKLPHKGKNQ